MIDVCLVSGLVQITHIRIPHGQGEWKKANNPLRTYFKEIYFNISLNLVSLGYSLGNCVDGDASKYCKLPLNKMLWSWKRMWLTGLNGKILFVHVQRFVRKFFDKTIKGLHNLLISLRLSLLLNNENIAIELEKLLAFL